MLERSARWAEEHAEVLRIVWDRYARTGDWPDPVRLTRELFVHGPRLNFTVLAQDMPSPLGGIRIVSTGADRVVALTPRGLSYVADAAPLLVDFFRLICLARERFADIAEPAILRSAEIAARLGVDEGRMRQLERMALEDGWLLRAHGGEPGAMGFQVDEHAALATADVESIEDYFEAQAQAWWPTSVSSSPSVLLSEESGDVDLKPSFRLTLEDLHPVVSDACKRFFEAGHPAEAVRHAVIAVLDELRDLAGLEADGADLVGPALSLRDPRVIVADLDTENGRNVQQGIQRILLGVVAAVRNPLAHRRIELSPAEALEQIGMLSFIMRRLDVARNASPERPG